MIVTELMPGKLLASGDTHRPKGLHLSDIIKSICSEWKPEVYGKPMDDSGKAKIEMGLKFEEVLEQSFQSAAGGSFRPDPILVPPGIWCSPDSVDPNIWAVEEFKLTWYSASKDCPGDEVFWPWLVQIKGYCKALGTTYAKLWVMHINGDYKPPKPWPPRVFGLEFGALEIEENWQMLVNHATQKGWL